MSESKAKNNTSDSTLEIGKRYAETSYKYFKLKAFQLLTTNVVMLTKMLLIGSIFFVGIVFLSISGAIALGVYFGSMPLGFLCIATIFFILGIIIYLIRGVISASIIKNLSGKFFEVPTKLRPENPKVVMPEDLLDREFKTKL